MGSKYPFPLLCVVLLASNIPLWANPLMTDRRDGDKRSPIDLSTGSSEPSIQNGDSSLFAPSQLSAPYSKNTSPIDSSNGFTLGKFPLFSTRLIRNALPVEIAVLFEGCSDGPACLVEAGLMLRF